jgi:hypothetical protein
MDDLFDALAKDASSKLSRRQVFGRFAFGMAMTALSALGLARASDLGPECGKCCAEQCRGARAPGEPTPGECMRDCLQGGTQFTVACAAPLGPCERES